MVPAVIAKASAPGTLLAPPADWWRMKMDQQYADMMAISRFIGAMVVTARPFEQSASCHLGDW